MRHYRKLIRLFAVIAMLNAASSAAGQDSRARISVVDADTQTTVFVSDGFAADREEALENAYVNVMQAILYSGVEGFNGGRPIVASAEYRRSNLWLSGMFGGKNPDYKQFCAGIELLGDFNRAASGETHCRANVVISHAYLLRKAETQGVTGAGRPQTVPAATDNPVPQNTAPESKPVPKKPKRSFL